MRLQEIFPRPEALGSLLARAQAFDDLTDFDAAVARRPLAARHAVLTRSIGACARKLEEEAGLPATAPDSRCGADSRNRPVFGGQQAYVDYYPAVLAKPDALESSGAAGFFALADYDTFGSDAFMSRTALPRIEPPDKGAPLLRLTFHPPQRRHRGKDMRFVPPPSREVLAEVAARLKGTITIAAKYLPRESFKKREAFRRLDVLMEEYETARRYARSAGAFNVLWSVRVLRRLGFRLPLISLSDLLAREEILPGIAGTLSIFVRRNALFAESIAEARRLAGSFDLRFAARGSGHVPLAMADARSGRRFALRLERRGDDHVLASPEGFDFEENVGPAGVDELSELLCRHAGRWSLDVFAPLFLFRLGVEGIVNGRGSIRYSLVLAHVLERTLGGDHPPNLLCSCSPPAGGPFTEAARICRGTLPASLAELEPTLIPRLLSADGEVIRREIAASWRPDPVGAETADGKP